jgi:RNA polymerase sigma-70 factor (ECF subfamily)
LTIASDAPASQRSNPSFNAIIEAAKAGGEWALAQLFSDYQPALLRYLRGRAGQLADDVASETWLAAARGLASFDGDADGFRAWLFTIARNRLTDERRRAKRRPVTAPADLTVEMPTREPSPEELVVSASAGDEAARRIAALLPADQADVILLRVVAGLSVDQVAAIIGKRPGTVRVLQSRGLKRLQGNM